MNAKTLKSTWLKLFIASCLCAAPLTVRAQFLLQTNANNTLTILHYTGNSNIVFIPSVTNGMTVTAVGLTSAVFGGSQVSVTIPATVTSIGNQAFQSLATLTNISIPDSVTSIGSLAFEGCSSLTNIVLPPNLTIIQEETFAGCTHLANVALPDAVTTIDQGAFDGCQNLQNVIIGPTVTTIGETAYEGTFITNLVIGTNGPGTFSPCAIGEAAFEGCQGMARVIIGSSVSSIGYSAFEGCGMTNLTIGTNDPASPAACSIGATAFAGISGLSNVVIGSTVNLIDAEAFGGCRTTNLTVGGNFAALNGGCFINYDGFSGSTMTTLFLGKNVSGIGASAFGGCSYLTNATIESGAISLTAFAGDGSLEFLTLGTNVTSIGYEAFAGCVKLTNAVIGGGSIGDAAFESDSSLTNVTLGPNVVSIGANSFPECGIRNLTIPDNVTSIGFLAFNDCAALGSVTLGTGITSVSDTTFAGCTALTNVTFGPNFSGLGYVSFAGCTNLTTLYFQGNAPAYDPTAFEAATNAHTTVYYFAGAIGWGSTYDGIPTVMLGGNALHVTLGPTEAITDGAQFQLDGSGAYIASTTLSDIAPGTHTISFVSIPGWNTPPSQTVTISNSTASIIGVYTPTATPSDGLILLTNGTGTITHSAWPKTLVAGHKYTVTAKPIGNAVFTSWVGGTTQPYPVLSTSTTYTFTMAAGLVVEANFESNPFNPGTYNGLFSTTNGVSEETAGMLKALTIGKTGKYSGSLLLNGASHGLTGTFNSFGEASNLISRPTAQGGPVRLSMTLSIPDNSGPEITGTVSGIAWTANLTADVATNALPSSEYTVLLLPDTSNAPPSSSPGGAGYFLITNYAGTLKNPAAASAKITAGLADGTTFSQSVPVSQSGYIPIYASLYANKGLLMGWINLASTSATAIGLTWIHPAIAHGLYATGFTNTLASSEILLSTWTNPPGNLTVLTNLSEAPVIDSTNSVNNAVTTTSSGKITGTDVAGTIDPKTGFVKVTIGSGSSKVTGYGAILQDSTNSGGYYLTKTNAQAIELGP